MESIKIEYYKRILSYKNSWYEKFLTHRDQGLRESSLSENEILNFTERLKLFAENILLKEAGVPKHKLKELYNRYCFKESYYTVRYVICEYGNNFGLTFDGLSSKDIVCYVG